MFNKPQLSLTDFNNHKLEDFNEALKAYKLPKKCLICQTPLGSPIGHNQAFETYFCSQCGAETTYSR